MAGVTRYRGPAPRPRLIWQWQDDAACRREDLVLFFGPDGERQPERERRERKAKAICAQCPVRNECLDHALAAPEKSGTWGGLNEEERASERRRRQRRKTPVHVVEVPDDKACGGCETVKPATDFYREPRSSDGLRPECKDCTYEQRSQAEVVAS
ncbi:WhiB family transcriptional regulator [Streptomyces sp.]|uniref:WhiB family transcriptional regulator n=1 Tax=Streptomyces sp. TaxID=1931 RepID=UPI002F925354